MSFTCNLMEEIFTHILNLGYYLLSFLVVISVIVFIHEYGHYIVAKLCGVKIDTFSIGFGKELFGFNDKSGTRWKFSVVPAGGYVKMFGDEDEASRPAESTLLSMSDEEKNQAFYFKKLYQKALIVAAGPVANFILAAVILSFFYISYGKPYTPPIINHVVQSSVAEKSGLQIGDEILAIDDIKIETFDDVVRIISTNTATELDISYLRNGNVFFIKLVPEIIDSKDVFGNASKSTRIGISANVTEYKHLPLLTAIYGSVIEVKNIIGTTCRVLWQMITGQRNLNDLGGPIRIVKYSGQSIEKGGLFTLWFIAMLSVNIGFMNLLPIPILDGGHLFSYCMEIVGGKRLAARYQKYAMKVGIVLIAMIFALTTLNDLKMLFF